MDNKTLKNCNFKQRPNQIHSKFSKPEYTYKEVSKNCKGLFIRKWVRSEKVYKKD